MPPLLDKHHASHEQAPSPKSNASVKSCDGDDDAASESAPPDDAASPRSLSRRLSGLLSGGKKTDNSNESRAPARTLVLRGHTDWVTCLAKLDGGRLASGSYDKSIIIWNLADGKQLARLEGHPGRVGCLAELEGGRLASGSYDESDSVVVTTRTASTTRSTQSRRSWIIGRSGRNRICGRS